MNKEISADTSFSVKRKLLFVFTGIFILLFLIIAIGEIIMRVTAAPMPPPYNNKEKDKVLGWKSKPFYRYYNKEFSDNKGGKYEVNLNFTKHGFRMWSEPPPGLSKGNLFVIGDSYVESIESSDNKVFYSLVKDSCSVNVSAYGTAGYGYTQEMMVVKQYIDSVKPDWVVLVTCANDYIDNYWEMEKTAWYKVGQTRPYLTLGNKIEYHFPRPWYEQVKEYSLFLNFLFERLHTSLVTLKVISVPAAAELFVNDQDRTNPAFNTSCLVTENVLKNMKQLVDAHHAKFIVYILGDLSGTKNKMDFIVAACKRNNIDLITGAEEQTLIHEKNGETIHSWDNYHFNDNGQKILGQVLIDYFKEHKLTPGK